MRRSRRLCLISACLLSLMTTACSSIRPDPSGRLGLIDRMERAQYPSRYPANEGASADSRINRTPEQAAVEVKAAQLHWPLQQVWVTSPFGLRGREFHEGIDLRAHRGTSVYAAQDGIVAYAGSKIRGYGRMVVIRHTGHLSTIYAHNSRLLVRSGQYVHQGQKIAISGNTGHSHGPHLHFEIRDGLTAVDPISVLPTMRIAGLTTPSPTPVHRLTKKVIASTRSDDLGSQPIHEVSAHPLSHPKKHAQAVRRRRKHHKRSTSSRVLANRAHMKKKKHHHARSAVVASAKESDSSQ